jgi:hypothetical protein
MNHTKSVLHLEWFSYIDQSATNFTISNNFDQISGPTHRSNSLYESTFDSPTIHNNLLSCKKIPTLFPTSSTGFMSIPTIHFLARHLCHWVNQLFCQNSRCGLKPADYVPLGLRNPFEFPWITARAHQLRAVIFSCLRVLNWLIHSDSQCLSSAD